ncbi:MAG: hypothetical protein LBU46_04195, partial [Candidatus Accumulibacter sp.]|nr:hypothetical protein [Accumulibacter sp.]
MTEGTQNLIGQTAQNWLAKKPLTDYDYTSAFNEAMAGAVGGGIMGAGGGLLGNRLQAGRNLVDNPYGTEPNPTAEGVDKRIGGAIGAAGEALKRGVEAGKPLALDVLKRATSVSERLRNKLVSAGENVTGMDVGGVASQHADEVLAAPELYDAQEVEAAKEFKRDGDTARYRDKI